MVNAASSESFAVELVSIARGVRFDTGDGFEFDGGHVEGGNTESADDASTTVSDVFFFHVENTSDETVTWWYDEHYFFGSDGFQYGCGETISSGFGASSGDTPDPLPAHWYPSPEIQPGRKARCIAEFANPPADVRVEEITYEYEDDRYTIDVEPSELDDPPV
jgi:hypothetical protein